jgi:8-oxo-dGTP pyrophosphatase MutT (NUDIX family)
MQVTSPRPAATVMLFDGGGRVLLVQRSKQIQFFGGAYAFPGGRVEPADVPAQAAGTDPWDGHLEAPAGLDFAPDRARLYGAYCAAVRRELEEECGLALPRGAPLVVWARWITPEVEPKRYDTLFFLARLDTPLSVTVDGSEAVAHRWLKPSDALALAKTGEIVLPPPTFVTLTELAELSSVDAVFAHPGPVPEIFPRVANEAGDLLLLLPGDPLHPQGMPRTWPKSLPTRAVFEITDKGPRARFMP